MPREANDVKNYEDNFNRLYFEASRNPDFMKYNGDIADDINAILRATGRGGELYSKGDRTVEEVTKEIIKSNSLADGMEKLGQYLEETLADTPTPVEAPRDDKARVFSPKVTQSERITSAEAMQRMIDKYGKIKSGTDKGKARDMAFAKKVNDDTKVRTFTRTAAESDKLKDFQAERLRGEVLTNEVLSYVVISDTAAQNHARSRLERDGYQKLLKEWDGIASPQHGQIRKEDIALGETLLIESAKYDDLATTMKLIADLAAMGTASGQAVQALSMLKKMTPAGQLYYVQKAVGRLNKEYEGRIEKGTMDSLTISADLARAVLEAQTQQEIDDAVDALLNDVASQLPISVMDRWNAWRYLSMLGNPRTHIRNGVGNAIFTPVTFIKDLMKARIESHFIKDPNQRTASVSGAMQAMTKSGKYYDFASEDADAMRDTLQGNGKYNPKQAIASRKKPLEIGKFKGLQKIADMNSELLENGITQLGSANLLGDWTYLRGHYITAMTQFLQARNADLNSLYTTPEGKKLLNEARQYATLEAQKATFRDFSALAQWLNQSSKNKAFGWIIEGLFPFKKTPVNILRRGIEYSPIGFITTVTKGTLDLKRGDITANEFIDRISSGLTGTGIMALGLVLANLGVLRGGDDEDDKQESFDTLQGYQNYSLQIGDVSYTIDWSAPAALPLFLGVQIQSFLRSEDGLTGADIVDALSLIAEPMFSLSMLDGLNSTITSAGYSDSPLSTIILSTMMSYLGQGMPTLFGQTARTFSSTSKANYIDKNNTSVPKFLQQFWQQTVMSKTPGLYNKKMDRVDAWGRKDTSENAILRALENFLSPGYVNMVNTTTVDVALQKLADELEDTSVLPSTANKYFSVGGKRKDLTAEEYEKYATVRGQTAYDLLKTATTDATWDAMDANVKKTLVDNIYTYATAIGKLEVADDFEESAWIANAYASGDPYNYLMLHTLTADSDASTADTIFSMGWLDSATQGNLLKYQYYPDTTITDYSHKKYKYTLDTEWQSRETELYYSAFDTAYAELVASQKYQFATFAERMEMISDMQSDIRKAVKKQLNSEMSAAGISSEYNESEADTNEKATAILSRIG